MRLGRLRLPRGHGAGVHAIAEPGKPSRSNELAQLERARLEDGADDHDNAADHDGLFPSQDVAQPYGCDCAKETTQGVGADSDALDVAHFAGGATGPARVGCVNLGKVFKKGGQSEQTACIVIEC